LALARSARDERCAAYVHLALADASEGGPEATEHVRRAEALLSAPNEEERLLVAARSHELGVALDVEACDALARRMELGANATFEWWGARARRMVRDRAPGGAETVVAELIRLLAIKASAVIRGPAFAAGAELSSLAQLGDAARRLHGAALEDVQQLVSGCSAAFRLSILSRDWVKALRPPTAPTLLPEQVADIENLVRALGRFEQLRPLLVQVLDALVLWTGVERGLLLLMAPGGRLIPRVGRNLTRSDLVGQQLELSHTLAARALEQGEPIVAVDASGELDSVHASVHALRLRSVLCVPLMARGEAMGVVYLDDRIRRGAFGEKELAWVRLVSAVAAVAIADARDRLLLRRAARRAERAEKRMDATLSIREAELGEARIELARSQDHVPTRHCYDGIIGNSSAMQSLLALVDRVVVSNVPILLLGESGTGKELIARAIHRNGPRARMAFVAENCGAIPETLLESALFGHVRGAFTGAARSRAGLFDVADQGTLFLDEIAEMSLAMQTKLLRVLEEGEFWPVGSERSRRVDVRIIAATHRDLDAMVAAGTFRQDLFYRLNVVSVRIPALRERFGDVPLLVRHFITRYAENKPVSLDEEALDLMCRFPWPGNVRQLENEVRRAIVLCEGVITAGHLSDEVRRTALLTRPKPEGLELRAHVDALERDLVTKALERTHGNQTRAAELLGVSRFGLQKMVRRLEIRMPEAAAPQEARLSNVSRPSGLKSRA
ncbi:MAG TPA: sigma 54-interacting transcriptional regulator, partial [Polyangiaceae bacterium]|nr:sigma 54-interacting transcriptional regulator [Polyangiaceae bacterium]